MAANQTSNRSRSGNGKGSSHSVTRRAEPEQDIAASAYQAAGDMAERATDYISQSAAHAQGCIREHSGKSVMVSLVAGFGIGLLVGRALAKPAEPRLRSYRSAAEGIGRRLIDRIEGMIPETLAEHFGK